jgi:hypothetical protein
VAAAAQIQNGAQRGPDIINRRQQQLWIRLLNKKSSLDVRKLILMLHHRLNFRPD